MKASDIIDRLKEGNRRFMEDKLESASMDNMRRAELVSGQNPWAIVLSCSDSRVVPEAIFDAGLGELFVVRVAGNVANISTVASIEFAVAVLKIPVVVVLGHQRCGAVTAAFEGEDHGKNLNHLLSYIAPAMKAAGEDASVDEVAKKNAELTVKNLALRSEILSHAVETGDIQMIPAFYHLGSGEVEFL